MADENKPDAADTAVKGVAGAGVGAGAGWLVGTAVGMGAAALGVAASPVLIPLAVVAGATYGGWKGIKKMFD